MASGQGEGRAVCPGDPAMHQGHEKAGTSAPRAVDESHSGDFEEEKTHREHTQHDSISIKCRPVGTVWGAAGAVRVHRRQ